SHFPCHPGRFGLVDKYCTKSFTGSKVRRHRFASRLEMRVVWIRLTIAGDPLLPFLPCAGEHQCIPRCERPRFRHEARQVVCPLKQVACRESLAEEVLTKVALRINNVRIVGMLVIHILNPTERERRPALVGIEIASACGFRKVSDSPLVESHSHVSSLLFTK